MVRQLGQVSYNTFVKGLITEAGPLTFPDNATIEDMNCVLTLKGSHRRRYGLSEEADGKGFEFKDFLAHKNSCIASFFWTHIEKSIENNFLILIIGTTLFIFKVEQNTPLLFNKPLEQIPLDSYIIDQTLFKQTSCFFTSGKNLLFCGGPAVDPFYLQYEEGSFDVFPLALRIRDTQGIDDGLEVDQRPKTLSDAHLYNLINQGWLYTGYSFETGGAAFYKNWTIPDNTYQSVEAAFKVEFSFSMDGREIGKADVSPIWIDHPEEDFELYDYWALYAYRVVDAFNSLSEEARQGIKASVIASPKDIHNQTLRFEGPEPVTLTIQRKYKETYLYATGYNIKRRKDSISLQSNQINQAYYGTNTPYMAYYNTTKQYPSNAQQWFIGREEEHKINVDEVASYDFGTQAAPKGRLFLDPFTLNRSRYMSSLQDSPEKTRLEDLCFHGGRVFYLKRQDLLFSQLLENKENANKCYQEGDPTSENAFDLLDTDGGVLEVASLAQGVSLFEKNNGVFLFGANGIWKISGLSEDESFKATSYATKKISSVDCISKKAIVNVEGFPFFLSSSGIYAIQPNDYGIEQVVSLSASSIQSLYKKIPQHNLKNAIGVYDKGCQKIYWLYDITEKDDVVPNKYTRGLVYDIRLQAFYEMSFGVGSTCPYICSVFNTPWLETLKTNKELFDNDNTWVYDNEGNIVYTKTDIPDSSLSNVKFLACLPKKDGTASFTVCSFEDLTFTDWRTSSREGVPYESYFTTGYNTAGESDSKKDIVYLTTQLSRTEDAYDETTLANRSSCQMQIRWDYENTSYSGKWTKPVQIYRGNRIFAPTLEDPNYDNRGLPVVTTKHKVRGNGRAIQIKFTSEPGKNFEVLGWSMILGNRK